MFSQNDFLAQIYNFLIAYQSNLSIISEYPQEKKKVPYIVLRTNFSLNPFVSNRIKVINFEIIYFNTDKLDTSNFIDGVQGYFESNFAVETNSFAVEDFNCTASPPVYDSKISSYFASLSVDCQLSVK
jgi:hypothetical protein